MTKSRFVALLVSALLTVVALGCNPRRAQRSAHSSTRSWPSAARAKSADKAAHPFVPPSSVVIQERMMAASQAITELDVAKARELLDSIPETGRFAQLLRARLALTVGDCDAAVGLLGALGNVGSSAAELGRIAEGCSRAMAGAEVVTDESHGLWVRLQNSRDRVLVPLIAEVVDKVTFQLSLHLRTTLPRPIRVEVVSDLMTLSLLTGLPLEAAETTGTIAIARFGRVTMLSPRSTREGFPWQDTLAHELTHLVVSRKSGDEAPLWLQEGIAKREETRWRKPLPLDDPSAPRRLARRALIEGRSIGIEKLGASIALQPNPESAATAYAEVEDFLDYWLKHCGTLGLDLLLRDLRQVRHDNTDTALRSVSGYNLSQWIARWQADLRENTSGVASDDQPSPPGRTSLAGDSDASPDGMHADDLPALARSLRMSVLLARRRHWASSVSVLDRMASRRMKLSEVSLQLALAHSHLGHLQAARDAIGTATDQTQLDGAWLAQFGRIARLSGRSDVAEEAFERSLAFAPTAERVACRGEARIDYPDAASVALVPQIEPWRALCLDALGTERP